MLKGHTSWDCNHYACNEGGVSVELGTCQTSSFRPHTFGFRQAFQVMACSCSPSHIGWSTLTREWGAKGWKPGQREHPGAITWICAGPEIWALTVSVLMHRM